MHERSGITVYTFDFGERAAAQEVATQLVTRGYAAVAVTEVDQETTWQVVGVDAGPLPSADVQWWEGAEQIFIEELAARHLGSVRSLVMHKSDRGAVELRGTVLADRTSAAAASARLAAYQTYPARTERPVIRHGLADLPIEDGPAYTAADLSDIDEIDWAALQHAYGPADDVPELLWALAADDEGFDEALQDGFYSSLFHQGTCYTATPFAVPYLARLAATPDFTPSYRIALLQAMIELSTVGEPGNRTVVERTVAAVTEATPRVLASWPDTPDRVRPWMAALAAVTPGKPAAAAARLREYRAATAGPSPALDLALALHTDDHEAADAVIRAAARWDHAIRDLLFRADPTPSRSRTVLSRLADAEFARR
ncbi:hypothetical protein [Nocardia vaccinii]|uniref:hypothetical protein n=1 Tax=Nocardia vaccinii TaxID=1822 RepID=UPI0012F4AA51|nr:hypothetical protein [Nocardia vaccinii]